MKTQINSVLRVICILASLVMAVSSAMAQAYEPFNYPAGTAPGNGGTGWAASWTPNGTVVVAPGLTFTGLSTSGNALGGTPGSAATRLLQAPVVGAAGTSVVLHALIKSPVNGTPGTQATLGNSPGGMGNTFTIGDLPMPPSQPNANKWGMQNACGNFYSNKLVVANQTAYLVARIDFNVSGANDRMRLWVQTTGAAVPYSTLWNNPADVDVLCNANTFGGVFWQTQQGQVVDEIGVDTLVAKGMTWRHTASNAQTGTITVGCDGCDAYQGDTQCTQQRPVLCIYKPPTPFPLPLGVSNSNQYYLWSGGVVATTQPHVGMNSTAATAYCQAQFGPLFRVAEFHDGWGWGFQAYGGTVSAPTVPSTRFWVYINDQPGANCP
jgi:hypothetical protein